MSIMNGKKGLIMGVANERSIAWGIAKTSHSKCLSDFMVFINGISLFLKPSF